MSEPVTFLQIAIENGDTETVELLLQNNVHCSSELSKLLHVPVLKGHTKTVEALLRHGADVNFLSKRGNAPLHIATGSNNKDMVLLLLSYQANVNIREDENSINLTPLHIASKRGYVEIVQVLLSHGAQVNSVSTTYDYNNYTPLHCAVVGKHKDTVEVLLSNGAKVDFDNNNIKTMLCLAVETGSTDIVEIILKYSLDVHKETNRMSLIIALCGYERKYKSIVGTLFQYGFTIEPKDARNCKLLHKAIENGYINVVDDLIKFGADVNMSFYDGSLKRYSPLYSAVKNSRIEIAQILIQYGADVNLSNNLLHIAVGEGHVDMVKFLLQHVDVNTEDEQGKTPLHVAVEGMQYQNDKIKETIAKLLISKGADVNIQNENQETALMAASKLGNIKAVKFLLEYGADVNAKQIGQKTAAQAKKLGWRERLPGQTALHHAGMRRHFDVVKILLENGSDVNITNSLGQTPREIAEGGCEMFRIFEHQFVRLQCANLHLSLENKCYVDQWLFKYFGNQCEAEIVRLKKMQIPNSKISLYDILTKYNRLEIFMKNESVVETLEACNYKKSCPIYCHMILSNFKKALEKKRLMKECAEMFPSLIYPELSLECVEMMLTFLNNNDLKCLKRALETH